VRKPARQGSKIAKKGAYIDVRDRILQPLLTMKAKKPTNFLLSIGFFAFVGFIDGLCKAPQIVALCYIIEPI